MYNSEKEAATRLERGEFHLAKLKAEDIWHHKKIKEAYLLIQSYLKQIITHADALQLATIVPHPVLQAVCTVLYASGIWVSQLVEMKEIAKMLKSKFESSLNKEFGKGFVKELLRGDVRQGSPVDPIVVSALSDAAAKEATKENILREIVQKKRLDVDLDAVFPPRNEAQPPHNYENVGMEGVRSTSGADFSSRNTAPQLPSPFASRPSAAPARQEARPTANNLPSTSSNNTSGENEDDDGDRNNSMMKTKEKKAKERQSVKSDGNWLSRKFSSKLKLSREESKEYAKTAEGWVLDPPRPLNATGMRNFEKYIVQKRSTSKESESSPGKSQGGSDMSSVFSKFDGIE